MALKNFLEKYQPALNSELRMAVAKYIREPADFSRMLEYHLGWVDRHGEPAEANPGKQIRPVLLLLCTEIAGGDWQQALPAAAAIELVHNFSLIHDDIEDNSALRRGRQTLWKIWGEAISINAGDAMFALAHRELLRLSELGVPAPWILESLRIFEDTNIALTRGQHLDIQFEHRTDVSLDEYIDMIGGKSASLIAASARIGAVIGGVPSKHAQWYDDLGFNLGLAFQIRDDILGIWGDPKVTGKSAATDIISRKKSFPVLFGLARSNDLVQLFARPHQDGDIETAVAILDELGARSFAEGYEQRYSARVSEALEQLNGNPEILPVLHELVDLLFGRTA